jgi:hypothetical protein
METLIIGSIIGMAVIAVSYALAKSPPVLELPEDEVSRPDTKAFIDSLWGVKP